MDRWVLDREFVEAVHSALRRLRREDGLSHHPLAGLSAVTERLRREGWPETDLARATALREVLTEARQRLAEAEPDGAALLERRFWRGETAVRLSHEWSIAESTLYARQEQAIRDLARALWAMELSARKAQEAHRQRLLRHIPPPTYARLFGLDDAFTRLRAVLTGRSGPWVISIEGLGGLGKTALAHRVVTWAARHASFVDLAWITAQQYSFATWRGVVEWEGAGPALTFETFLDRLATQFERPDLLHRPLAHKKAKLRDLLKERAYLVVVDNLETAADQQALIPRLWELANPTRFLLTSRHSLGQHSCVLCLTLSELSESDSLALMRYEARCRGVDALADADETVLRRVYEVTGGNPLAIKLVIGQARSLPLDRVLARLREAQGRQYEDLYRFIYWYSWEMLSDDARRVLLAMPALAPSGAYWENLRAATGLPDHRLDEAVEQLVAMSLLQVAGREEKRYTIHQLTHTFVLSDLLGEWGDGDG